MGDKNVENQMFDSKRKCIKEQLKNLSNGLKQKLPL